MTTQPQFELRRLEVGEKLSLASDFLATETGKCVMVRGIFDSLVVGEEVCGDFYRISLLQPPAVAVNNEYPDEDEQQQNELVANQPPAPEPVKDQPVESPGVDVGEGWRLLASHEAIIPGDEFQATGWGLWSVVHNQEFFGKPIANYQNIIFRRRVADHPATQPEPAPQVDLRQHEREEYQKAIVELVMRCDEIDQLRERVKELGDWLLEARKQRDDYTTQLADALAGLATAKAERDRLTRERDQLWESLKSKTQDANNELAKQQPEPVKWRTLTKNDTYSGPGQVQDGIGNWQEASILSVADDDYPFIARCKGDVFPMGWQFARVREGGGEQ